MNVPSSDFVFEQQGRTCSLEDPMCELKQWHQSKGHEKRSQGQNQ